MHPEGEEIIKKEDIIACRQSVPGMLPREKKQEVESIG
jgi:hypothetical protein